MAHRPAISVLFVCSGNRCCSPAALAVATTAVAERGIGRLHLDAAGTSPRRRGDTPHPASAAEGARRGHRVDHRARPIHPDDFAEFDLIVAMHRSNVDDLLRLRGSVDQRTGRYAAVEPDQFQLLRRWDPYAMPGDEDLPHPRGHARDAMAVMYDVLERSIPPLLDHLAWLADDALRDAP